MKNLLKDKTNKTNIAEKIAFVHHKGGTGKTTSCLNIAGWLAKMNKQVLVVDLDPQGNATCGLGVDRKSLDGSVYDVLFRKATVNEFILETDSGVYLLPSSPQLLGVETHLAGHINNTLILKEKLISIDRHFDYIFIDVPPGSTILMINGILASDNIIIPIDAGVFAYETLDTLKNLVVDLQNELGIEVNIMMFLLRRYSNAFFDYASMREISRLIKGFMIENNIGQVEIVPVPFSRKIYRTQMKGEPISHYSPLSGAGRA